MYAETLVHSLDTMSHLPPTSFTAWLTLFAEPTWVHLVVVGPVYSSASSGDLMKTKYLTPENKVKHYVTESGEYFRLKYWTLYLPDVYFPSTNRLHNFQF